MRDTVTEFQMLPHYTHRFQKGQQWAATTDLAGQFIHQGHNGVLEECGGGQRPLGDLRDAQVAIWPHLLQDLAGTAKRKKRKRKGHS